MIHGLGCESPSLATRGWEHPFSKCMQHPFPWAKNGTREPLTASPIHMAGEVLLLELSEGVLVTPYCL